MTSITINAPAKIATPRGAPVAAALFGQLLTWLSAVVHARAQRVEMTDRTTEANRVRDFANAMLGQDPRFAADLYAAADRHERS